MSGRRKADPVVGLLSLLFLPFMVIGGILKTTGKSRRRGGVMCGPGGSRKRKKWW